MGEKHEPYRLEHYCLQCLHRITGACPCLFPHSAFESAWFAPCTRLLDSHHGHVVGRLVDILRVCSLRQLDILHQAHSYYEIDDPSVFPGSCRDKNGAPPNIGTRSRRFAIRRLDVHRLERRSVADVIPRRTTMRRSGHALRPDLPGINVFSEQWVGRSARTICARFDWKMTYL